MSIRVGRDRRSHAWGAPVEKRPRLTLLDEKWFPPFDDKLILLGKDGPRRRHPHIALRNLRPEE